MTEKKSNEEKVLKQEINAGQGAPEEAVISPVNAAVEQTSEADGVEIEAPKKKAARRPATRAPRKKKPVDPSGAKEVVASPLEVEKTDPVEVVATEDVPVAEKRSRRPARPRRKKSVEEIQAEQSAFAAAEGTLSLAEESSAETVEQITDVTAESGVEVEAVPASRKRSSRSRRKKTGAEPHTELHAEKREEETGVVSGDVAPDEAVSGTQEVLSERSSRGRKKRKPVAAQDDLPSDEQEDEEIPDVEDEHIVKSTVSRLLINAEEPEECRIALLEDGRLESLHVSTVAREHTKSNIYKARIVAVESSLQAAFVDYGTEKNGFLPFSEIHPEYFRHDLSEKTLQLVEQRQWKKLNINEVLERGQEMLVQVVKEEVGSKGANMTTYLSLPGRCVVLMPGSDSSGISRKITGEERRSRLREIMDSLEIPEGIGWIVRTASIDLTEESLSKDVTYLLKLWGEIKSKGQNMPGAGLVYQDHDCVLRFLREHFDPEIREILVDDVAAMEKVQDFVDLLPDKQRNTKVRLHKGSRPIFNQYNIEDQIESIYQPRVLLPSGGSIVIDPTEALVAIDVNSGSTGKGQNFEDSIFKANMEAATELARQLRLRDLGGLIVVDFIDMRSQKNIREVERQVKIAMKRDKAKVDISRISKFGLMQISRQKLGAPIEALNYQVCPHCAGRGVVRSVETLALFYLRRIQTGASRKLVARVECHFPLDVAGYLLNRKRHELMDLEERCRTTVEIIPDPALKPADNEIIFHKQDKERTVKE